MFDKEQIIKAWECCGSTTYRCDECPIEQQKKDDCICGGYLAQCALALYRKLTEENERLRVVADMSDATLTDALRIVSEFCDKRIMRAKADTVRRMQERLKLKMDTHTLDERFARIFKADVDQIAKEILEETK